MASRAQTATKEFIKTCTLPEGSETYTVIPHGFVIDRTIEQLATAGFAIERELYRCAKAGDLAQGVYHLKYDGDPEMGMMFAWSNSYDKSRRFKCAIGGYVFCCMNGVISGTMGSWARRHVGEADKDTIKVIEHQIMNAEDYYKQLVSDKANMKEVIVNKRLRAELMGRIYFEHGYLNSEQVNIVKNQFNTPEYDYNADKDSLWTMYNHITYSLRKAHPSYWLDQQRLIHHFLCDSFSIETATGLTPEQPANSEGEPIANPNQVSIFDVPGVDPEQVTDDQLSNTEQQI